MKSIASVLVLFFVVSCSTDDSGGVVISAQDYSEQNEIEITEYLAANDLVAQKSETGLHYSIENQGTGKKPDADSNVTVLYTGYFLNGTVFEENLETGITSDVNEFIPGWVEGIPLLNEGGNGVLFIPAHLAYGSFANNGIPAGSVLIFDIELVSVN